MKKFAIMNNPFIPKTYIIEIKTWKNNLPVSLKIRLQYYGILRLVQILSYVIRTDEKNLWSESLIICSKSAKIYVVPK